MISVGTVTVTKELPDLKKDCVSVTDRLAIRVVANDCITVTPPRIKVRKLWSAFSTVSLTRSATSVTSTVTSSVLVLKTVWGTVVVSKTELSPWIWVMMVISPRASSVEKGIVSYSVTVRA